MKTLVILQPSFLPWRGYFDLIKKSDLFIFYDHVQYDKNGWRNRNKILNKENKREQWITLPVSYNNKQKLNEIKLVNYSFNFKKIKKILYQNYSKHKNFLFIKLLEEAMSKNWVFLSDLNIFLIKLICEYLNIPIISKKSSELKNIPGKNENLINLCKQFSCDSYLSGLAAKKYIDEKLFLRENIKLTWHDYVPDYYAQVNLKKKDFVNYLSVIDYIFNMEKQ